MQRLLRAGHSPVELLELGLALRVYPLNALCQDPLDPAVYNLHGVGRVPCQSLEGTHRLVAHERRLQVCLHEAQDKSHTAVLSDKFGDGSAPVHA